MSKGGGSQTTRTEPPKFMVPFLQEGMREAQSLYRQGAPQFYPGQTVVGFSPETEAALGMQTQRAQGGSPLLDQAQSYASNLIGRNQPITFGGASNPHLDATFNRGADQIMNRLKTDFAGSGRNTGAAMPVAGEQLGAFANDLYGGAYESERNRMANEIGQQRQNQMSVLGMAPGLANADYADIDRLAQVGQVREDLTGRQIDDAAARWDFGQNAPGMALDQYLGRLQGYPGSTTSQPTSRNVGAGALGGAMLGNILFPGLGGIIGGGLLGGLG